MFIKVALTQDMTPFTDVVEWHYTSKEASAPKLLDLVLKQLDEVVEDNGRGDVSVGGLQRVSKGALVILKGQLWDLRELKKQICAQVMEQ
jgi:hypothetical protein